MQGRRNKTEEGSVGLQPGEEAPDFRLPSAQGEEVSLSQYRGFKNVFLVFLKGMT